MVSTLTSTPKFKSAGSIGLIRDFCDLFWTAVLFGAAWAIQNGAMLAGRAR
jgi:hypothetical protein